MANTVLFLATLFTIFTSTITETEHCDRTYEPHAAQCSGCPPRFNGKLCASTTYFQAVGTGFCECKSTLQPHYTAALNTKMMKPLARCGSGCGLCYELCSTGGLMFESNLPTPKPGTCHIFQIKDHCPSWDWCGQEMNIGNV